MFDKDLDRSLWFILEGDVENRKEIIEFLKRIPNDMYETIRNILASQDSEEAKKARNGRVLFEGSTTLYDGVECSYEIEYMANEKTLVIRQDLAKPAGENAAFVNFGKELLLASDDLFPFDQDDEYWLGDFTREMSIYTKKKLNLEAIKDKFMPFFNIDGLSAKMGGYMKEQEFEYELINSSDQHNVRRSESRSNITEAPVDMSMLPSDLSIEYIEQRYGDTSVTKNHTL